MIISIVINTRFGGFSLDKEMVDFLESRYSWSKDGKIVECLGDYYPNAEHWGSHSAMRQDKDLIDCVSSLQSRGSKGKVRELEIVKLKVIAQVEDYYDGMERVTVDTQEIV